jgi:hypothetical protein
MMMVVNDGYNTDRISAIILIEYQHETASCDSMHTTQR